MSGGLFSGITQGSSGSGLIGGLIDVGTGFAASSQAYKRTRKMYRHRFQWAAEDLEKAGLNRILALTQGPGSPGSNVPQAQTRGGLADAAAKAALLRSQLRQIDASTAKTIAETAIIGAGVPTARAKEDVLQWFFNQLRGAIRGGTNSAKDLLSPEARDAFGISPKQSPAEKYGPIRVVPKGQKYRGEK